MGVRSRRRGRPRRLPRAVTAQVPARAAPPTAAPGQAAGGGRSAGSRRAWGRERASGSSVGRLRGEGQAEIRVRRRSALDGRTDTRPGWRNRSLGSSCPGPLVYLPGLVVILMVDIGRRPRPCGGAGRTARRGRRPGSPPACWLRSGSPSSWPPVGGRLWWCSTSGCWVRSCCSGSGWSLRRCGGGGVASDAEPGVAKPRPARSPPQGRSSPTRAGQASGSTVPGDAGRDPFRLPSR